VKSGAEAKVRLWTCDVVKKAAHTGTDIKLTNDAALNCEPAADIKGMTAISSQVKAG
jgi:hypothetical protein